MFRVRGFGFRIGCFEVAAAGLLYELSGPQAERPGRGQIRYNGSLNSYQYYCGVSLLYLSYSGPKTLLQLLRPL